VASRFHASRGIALAVTLCGASVALIVFPKALVAVLFHYGQFQPQDVAQTTRALMGYGVGLMGLQIAKLMGAKLVLGSSTDAGRRARLGEFGCDVAVDPSDPAWPDRVLEGTGGPGVELTVDQGSAPVGERNPTPPTHPGGVLGQGFGRVRGCGVPRALPWKGQIRYCWEGDRAPGWARC